MSLMDKLKDVRRRAKQAFYERSGKAEKTEDPEFTALEEQLRVLEDNASAFYKHARAFHDGMTAMTSSSVMMAESLTAIFDNPTYSERGAVMRYKDLCENLISNTYAKEMSSNFTAAVLHPLAEYLNLFKPIHEKIKRRNNLLLDFDSYRRKVRDLADNSHANPNAIVEKERKLAIATQAYQDMNDEVVHDMKQLVMTKTSFFHHPMMAAFAAHMNFLANAGEAMQSMLHEMRSTPKPSNAGGRLQCVPYPQPVKVQPPKQRTQAERSKNTLDTARQLGILESHSAEQPPQQPPATMAYQHAAPAPAAPPAPPMPPGGAAAAAAPPAPQPQQHAPHPAAAAIASAMAGTHLHASSATREPVPPAGPPPPQSRAPAADTVKALYAYTAQNANELSLHAGQVITVKQRDSSGWWEGEVNGTTGWFPSNYVE